MSRTRRSGGKVLLEVIRPHVKLYRDPKTGIAWVEDGTSGNGHSCHPNISSSGSVSGMKSRGHWGRSDRTVRSHGFVYNIDHLGSAAVRRLARLGPRGALQFFSGPAPPAAEKMCRCSE